MKLFGQRRKGLTIFISLVLLSLVMAACGAGGGTTPSGGAAAPVNGKGCTKVGILLPETASSARWESEDHPLLVKDLTAVVGSGGSVDYANAEGNDATQVSIIAFGIDRKSTRLNSSH